MPFDSKRRSFGRGLAIFAIATQAPWTLCSATAQQPSTPYRIGYLTPSSHPEREALFRQALRRLGYAEGKNVVVEYRSAQDDFARLSELAAELVKLNVNVIVAVRTQASVAAKRASATIPIVMLGVGDPVGSGLVASLARPGGNVTGTSTQVLDVVGKQMELVRELIPRASRIAILWNPANPVFQQQQMKEVGTAAAALRMQLQFVEASAPEGLDRAFADIDKARVDGVLVVGDPMFASQTKRIANLALKYRVAAVSVGRPFAQDGIVAIYGPDFNEDYSRAATYVDKILKGAKPADLPIELNSKFELVVNARTAKAIGIVIPPSLASRANDVIQ